MRINLSPDSDTTELWDTISDAAWAGQDTALAVPDLSDCTLTDALTYAQRLRFDFNWLDLYDFAERAIGRFNDPLLSTLHLVSIAAIEDTWADVIDAFSAQRVPFRLGHIVTTAVWESGTDDDGARALAKFISADQVAADGGDAVALHRLACLAYRDGDTAAARGFELRMTQALSRTGNRGLSDHLLGWHAGLKLAACMLTD